MNHKALKKLNTYVIWIDDYGSISINEWQELYNGHIIFCWAELINYADITKEPELSPFVNYEGQPLFRMPGQIRGSTIEEVIQNIKDDIQRVKDEKKSKIEEKAEAKKLMRKYIFKDREIGIHGDLQLRVMGFDLKKLCITTKVESNLNWEHVVNHGRKMVWHHNSSNIWEAKSKKESGQSAQSLMYIEDDLGCITLERDS